MPKSSVLNRFDETCQGTVPVALKIISMSTSYEDAIRMAISLGADADTLGAIVGSIAEAIWGTPYRLRDEIQDFLPEDMQMVLWNFHDACPWSDKLLIDTTFDGIDMSDASWDLLDDDERESLKKIVLSEKNEKRRVMLERAKARIQW